MWIKCRGTGKYRACQGEEKENEKTSKKELTTAGETGILTERFGRARGRGTDGPGGRGGPAKKVLDKDEDMW